MNLSQKIFKRFIFISLWIAALNQFYFPLAWPQNYQPPSTMPTQEPTNQPINESSTQSQEEIIALYRTDLENSANDDSKLTHQKKRKSKLSKLINKFLKEQTELFRGSRLLFNIPIYNNSVIRLGGAYYLKELPLQNTALDVDKLVPQNDYHQKNGKILLSSERRWFKTVVRVEPAIKAPLETLHDVWGDYYVGADLNYRIGKEYEYSATLPTPLENFTSKKFFPEAWNKIKTAGFEAIHFRWPKNALSLLDTKSYPAGSEFSKREETFMLAGIGISGQYQFIKAGYNIQKLQRGFIRKTIKIYREAGKTFALFTIGGDEENILDQNANLGFSLTYMVEKFTGGINIRNINYQKIKENNDIIRATFAYDLQNPQAITAFNQALNGNLIPSLRLRYQNEYSYIDDALKNSKLLSPQNLGKNNSSSNSTYKALPDYPAQDDPADQVDDLSHHPEYHGVAILNYENASLHKDITDLRLGLYFENIFLKINPINISIGAKQYSPLVFHDTHVNQYSFSDNTQYPFNEAVKKEALEFKNEKLTKILWGLIGEISSKYSYKNVISELDQFPGLKPNQQEQKKTSNEIYISYEQKGEAGFKKKYNQQISSAEYLLKVLKPDENFFLNQGSQSESAQVCHDNYTLNKSVVLFNKAIDHIINMDLLDFLKSYARYFDLPYSNDWLDAKKRNKIISDSISQRKKEFPHLKNMFNLLNKLESEKFIKKIESIKQKNLSELIEKNNLILKNNHLKEHQAESLRALKFHEIIEDFLSNPYFTDLLLVLISHDQTELNTTDFYYSFKLKCDDSEISWIASSPLTFNPDFEADNVQKLLETEKAQTK